jgi:hypothetical protein
MESFLATPLFCDTFRFHWRTLLPLTSGLSCARDDAKGFPPLLQQPSAYHGGCTHQAVCLENGNRPGPYCPNTPHLPDLIDVPVHPTHMFFILQIDYALSGSSGALGYDQIQLLDTSNPPTTGLDASAWEMTTQTLMNDWNEELPPQFRQGL